LEWKAQRPGRRVAVCGCLTEYDKRFGEYKKRFPEVDLWSPVNDVERVGELLAGASPSAGKPCYLNSDASPRLQLTLPHLSYLKIADGCNNCCTYCAIPKLRGSLRTRPQASVVREAKMLVDSGVRELVIVAQDTTAFGMDRPGDGETLCSLLRELEKLPGDFAIRLLYTHPAHYTDELIGFLASSHRVLPYLDIPLQHISDRVLKAMNRHVTKAEITALLNKLRAAIPNLILRTTFIVGFPGESEAEFDELCAFVRDFKFERMGVFPYAAEADTPAAKLKDQIPAEVAEERAAVLMRRQIARMKRRNRKLIGTTARVLVDSVDPSGVAVARGAMDAPDIDNAVLIRDGGRLRSGEWAEVLVVGAAGCDLVAERLRSARRMDGSKGKKKKL
jgi:ribosomal protein S12 methylthiotransferase